MQRTSTTVVALIGPDAGRRALEAVIRPWVALYDGDGRLGDLETAVADTTARWRGRSIELPDYYLVVDAGTFPATRRHWYLGVLRDVAPARIVPVDNDAAAIGRALSHLPSGRWWPDLPDLLDGIDRVAPGAVGTTTQDLPTDGRLVR